VEHAGLDLLKRDLLEDELEADAHQLNRAIKRALDPANLLNPGKAL
jgi:glycolate oxidase